MPLGSAWHPCVVQQVIDLDAAGASLERRLPLWRAAGMAVGLPTWADGQTTVHDVTTERSQVRGDYSVGIQVSRAAEEGMVVLYAGGWCDLEYWSGQADDEPLLEVPGWDEPLDILGFEHVLDRFESLFLHRR